jgi:uridine phosphorylase
MQNADAIVNPVKKHSSPDPGDLSVLVATGVDLFSLCRLMDFEKGDSTDLFISRLYIENRPKPTFSLTGPLIGAPYAVMLAETLIAWGAHKLLLWGWCGAISPEVRIGDIIVPSIAHIDEGTSPNYLDHDRFEVESNSLFQHEIKSALTAAELGFHEGAVWSTDAIFRETVEKVEYYQRQNVLAVEMESSALFSVGHFRQIQVGAILVVSDELSDFTWKPGFKSRRFKSSREAICRVIHRLCRPTQ